MRVVSLVLVCLLVSVVSAQEGDGENQAQKEQTTATTPSEARTPREQGIAALENLCREVKLLEVKDKIKEIPATLAEAHANWNGCCLWRRWP